MTKRYTPEQIDFLRTGYISMNARDLAQAFNAEFGTYKTERQIRSTLKNHDIRCGRKGKDRLVRRHRMFTEGQERFISSTFKSHTAEETARLLNARFDMSVTGQQIKTYVKNHGIASGRTGHFPKGKKPWNAGSKGQGLTGPNKGSFKKGDIPGNTKPLGHERIDSKDGYVLVKVAEPNPHTGAANRFKHKHIHIYEQEHGPVPEGMVVIFRDGDRRNFDPGNLEAITRPELVRLNQYGYSHVPDELKPSVLAMTKLKVKVFERSKERS